MTFNWTHAWQGQPFWFLIVSLLTQREKAPAASGWLGQCHPHTPAREAVLAAASRGHGQFSCCQDLID